MPLSALINSATNLIGNAQQNSYNKALVEQQNEANKELAQYQYELNMDAWREQSEYNSPSATMERLVAAGINPRAYQQLGQFANAQTPPQYQRPDIQRPEKTAPLAAFSDLVRNMLEFSNMQTQMDKNKADTAKSHAQEIYYNALSGEIGEAIKSEKDKRFFGNADNYLKLLKGGMRIDDIGDLSYISDRKHGYTLWNPENLFGLNAKSENFLQGIRALEYGFKKSDYEFLKKTGISPSDKSQWWMILLKGIARKYNLELPDL